MNELIHPLLWTLMLLVSFAFVQECKSKGHD